jgi:tetratricopeptide (TPR) repeat protein
MRLAGLAVVIVGGLASLPRRIAARLVADHGGRLARGLSRGSGLLVIGRRGPRAVAEGQVAAALDRADRLHVPVIGETAFLNLLALTDRRPAPAEDAKRFAGHGVSQNLARLLALLDIIDPAEELHARQAIKEVRRALADGMDANRLLCELLHEPERLRAKLPSLTLARDEAGRLGQRIAGRLADLDGQLRLDLSAPPGPSTDVLFEAAERAETAGSWGEAEQLYSRCLAREPGDATLHFNLGNVLRELGRLAEATAAFAKAAALDPEMAEAWFNLAGLAEVERKHVDAARRYRRALAIDPDYADALFNLARLETEREAFIDALPLWQRYLALDSQSRWGDLARKGAALCRQALMDNAKLKRTSIPHRSRRP